MKDNRHNDNHYNSLQSIYYGLWSFISSQFILIFTIFWLPFVFLLPANCSEINNNTHFFYEPHDMFYLMDEQMITIASKREEEVAKAPSIVTIITAKEIENMGGRTIIDILRTVPGFDILKSGISGTTDINVRGSKNISGWNPTVKVLIDGHSINGPLTGSATFYFDDLPLTNVKRIEIIRGPGSAIYGANAFLSVVNIITKSADDIDGFEIRSGFGSYDTQEYSMMYGKNHYGIDIVGFAHFYNTNGLSETIKEDALSSMPFFNRFSITPGNSDDSRNKLDLGLKLSYNDIELKAKYMNRDVEPFVGIGSVLNSDSDQLQNYVMADLSYKFDVGERMIISPRIYYDHHDGNSHHEHFPAGYIVPFDLDGDGNVEIFEEGMESEASATWRRIGGEVQMDYELSDNNALTLGFSYEWERQDNLQFRANFDPLTGATLDSFQNVSDIANIAREAIKQIWAIYLQDKWDITDNLGLTFGVRHDHYSDFEGTTNPRIGFVWEFMENANLKLLYGQAFRAPNFAELYLINNPAILGNPDLKPETIRTYELGLGYEFRKGLNTNVNYFYNVLRDEIGISEKTYPGELLIYNNLGSSNSQGIEFEVKADFPDLWNGVYAFANYTYLDAESSGSSIADIPKHKGNIGFNVGITKYLNANLHAFISDERSRAEEDKREDSPGYAIVNLTLIAKEFFKAMKVTASLSNLLDKKYKDPTPINTVPKDLPRPGRTFFLQFEYDL